MFELKKILFPEKYERYYLIDLIYDNCLNILISSGKNDFYLTQIFSWKSFKYENLELENVPFNSDCCKEKLVEHISSSGIFFKISSQDKLGIEIGFSPNFFNVFSLKFDWHFDVDLFQYDAYQFILEGAKENKEKRYFCYLLSKYWAQEKSIQPQNMRSNEWLNFILQLQQNIGNEYIDLVEGNPPITCRLLPACIYYRDEQDDFGSDYLLSKERERSNIAKKIDEEITKSEEISSSFSELFKKIGRQSEKWFQNQKIMRSQSLKTGAYNYLIFPENTFTKYKEPKEEISDLLELIFSELGISNDLFHFAYTKEGKHVLSNSEQQLWEQTKHSLNSFVNKENYNNELILQIHPISYLGHLIVKFDNVSKLLAIELHHLPYCRFIQTFDGYHDNISLFGVEGLCIEKKYHSYLSLKLLENNSLKPNSELIDFFRCSIGDEIIEREAKVGKLNNKDKKFISKIENSILENRNSKNAVKQILFKNKIHPRTWFGFRWYITF